MTNELTQFSKEALPAIEAEMKAVLRADGRSSDDFFGMMHYHMGWADEQLQPATVKSGKRIRPILCLLVCAAAGGDWQQAVPAAAAVEILHNFSLIHDDIEDASPTRRGRTTLWQIWGMELAINSGDAMFALAHVALGRLIERGVEADIVVQALRRFDESCLRLTQGQHADISFERRQRISVDDYMEMITGKTAVLLSHCAELGALVAGCDAETVANYATFGLDLGLAFQVIDDILGIWGDEELTGKSAATDIITKKKTLPVLYGLAQDEGLRQLYQQSAADQAFVQQVVERLDQCGARDFATAKASTYSHSASHHLEAANPTGLAALALQQLTAMLLKRDF
jgi:geranylgeranyl diphosphate synthase type I